MLSLNFGQFKQTPEMQAMESTQASVITNRGRRVSAMQENQTTTH